MFHPPPSNTNVTMTLGGFWRLKSLLGRSSGSALPARSVGQVFIPMNAAAVGARSACVTRCVWSEGFTRPGACTTIGIRSRYIHVLAWDVRGSRGDRLSDSFE